jgi:outer membrane lipoprotein-sorting protein
MKFILASLLFIQFSWSKNFIPQSFTANFEESLISMATGKEKKSYGKIDYKYPGHVRFEITSPNPSLFVSNPQMSWYYVPPFIEGEEGQVTLQKTSKLPLTKFFDSMKNGLENSKLFTHTYAKQELFLNFKKEVQKEMTLKQVIFKASADAKLVQKMNDFEKITLIYVDGRKVNLKFTEFKEDVSFQPKQFEFTPPTKTKVIKD